MMKIAPYVKECVKKALLPHGTHPARIRAGALEGFRLHFDLQHDTQVWRGVYEQGLQAWLTEVVQEDSTCIDVGAAEGWATLLMASRCPSGVVYAFEPGERGDWVQPNLDLNHSAALGEVVLRRDFVGAESSDTEEVPSSISLDDFIESEAIDCVDVVKIDVDGPECDVLDGSSGLLRRFRPQVCVETHSRALTERVLSQLRESGYDCRVVEPPPHEHRPIEYNPMVFATPIEHA